MSGEKPRLLAWTDLETDGLDHIIEAACVLTDENLVVLGEFEMVVAPPADLLLADIPAPVLEMHVANGLWHEALASTHTLTTLRTSWIQFFRDKVDDGQAVRLAGSGVSHFDSNLIAQKLPGVFAWFEGYSPSVKPTLDVGVMRRVLNMSEKGRDLVAAFEADYTDTDLPQVGLHRAMYDVHKFIAELAYYQANLDLT